MVSPFCTVLDESGVVSRTRSLDSIDAEDEEDREIPTKKKKHRPLEESVGTGKKTDKLKRRQHVERASSEGVSNVQIKGACLWDDPDKEH